MKNNIGYLFLIILGILLIVIIPLPTGLRILFLIIALIVLNYKKIVTKIKSSSSKLAKTLVPKIKTGITYLLIILLIWNLIIYLREKSDYRNPSRTSPVSQQTIIQSRPQVYLQYGTYAFQRGVPRYYIRDTKDLYMYPAVPGTTITLHFQQANNPSSYWDYKVTRRLDGTIKTGDDQRFNDQDKYGYGIHSVTLISGEDADVVLSGHPL